MVDNIYTVGKESIVMSSHLPIFRDLWDAETVPVVQSQAGAFLQLSYTAFLQGRADQVTRTTHDGCDNVDSSHSQVTSVLSTTQAAHNEHSTILYVHKFCMLGWLPALFIHK